MVLWWGYDALEAAEILVAYAMVELSKARGRLEEVVSLTECYSLLTGSGMRMQIQIELREGT